MGKLRNMESRDADAPHQEVVVGPSSESQSTSSLQVGYSAEEVQSVPVGSDLGLGCGNPHAIAALQPGETVLDLGSGAGFDCFLAAATGRENRACHRGGHDPGDDCQSTGTCQGRSLLRMSSFV